MISMSTVVPAPVGIQYVSKSGYVWTLEGFICELYIKTQLGYMYEYVHDLFDYSPCKYRCDLYVCYDSVEICIPLCQIQDSI